MKKRTIRNWGIALILLLLSGIVMLTASAVSNTPQAVDVTLNEKLATSAPTNEISEEELMNIIESQQPAITAHEEFQENLVWDNELGDYLYPDTFAGAYLDKETFQLCVALTDCSEKIKAEYNKYFSDPAVVSYVEAEYSYNDLLAIKEEVKASCDNITSIGINQRKNIVSVGLSSEASVQNMSQSAARSAMPIEVYYEGSGVLDSIELRGGDSFGPVTLGVCGTFNGTPALLTCGHGPMGEGDGIILNSTALATVTKVQWANNQPFDYAIITIDNDTGIK